MNSRIKWIMSSPKSKKQSRTIHKRQGQRCLRSLSMDRLWWPRRPHLSSAWRMRLDAPVSTITRSQKCKQLASAKQKWPTNKSSMPFKRISICARITWLSNMNTWSRLRMKNSSSSVSSAKSISPRRSKRWDKRGKKLLSFMRSSRDKNWLSRRLRAVTSMVELKATTSARMTSSMIQEEKTTHSYIKVLKNKKALSLMVAKIVLFNTIRLRSPCRAATLGTQTHW